jgi:hypothetical protein
MSKALSEQIEVELCMRAFAPEKTQGRQQDSLDRIQELDEADVVDGYVLTWWARKVCAPSEDGLRALEAGEPATNLA